MFANEEMDNWDPMTEDFLSHRNSYKVDVDDPGVATVNYSMLLHFVNFS